MEPNQPNPILKFFAYEHLPQHLQGVSKPIGDLAQQMAASLPPSAETSAGLRKLRYTDGVRLLAESAQCYWLLDVILSYQEKLKDEPFQSWRLEFDDAGKYRRVTANDGNGKALATQAFSYTSFPAHLLPMRLWVSDGVLLLPEEY